MKKVYYIAFYVLLLSFPGICRADFEADRFFDCAGMQVPLRIIFKTSYGQLIHDVSTEEKSILNNNNNLKTEKLYLNSSYNSVQPYGYVTLTSALTEYISNNKTCIIPETIEVFIGYRDPMIYIAKEFRSKPCEFSVMLRHQQVHQQINIYTLQYLLPLMKEAIISATQNITPIVSTSKSSFNNDIKKLQEIYTAAIQPILIAFDEIRQEENRKFDEVTNYKIDEKLCQKYNLRRLKSKKQSSHSPSTTKR